mgnify:CR=1 FL=1
MMGHEDDTLGMTKHWFEKAVPNPQTKNFTTQLGAHFEEIAEMMNCPIGTVRSRIYRRATQAPGWCSCA